MQVFMLLFFNIFNSRNLNNVHERIDDTGY